MKNEATASMGSYNPLKGMVELCQENIKRLILKGMPFAVLETAGFVRS